MNLVMIIVSAYLVIGLIIGVVYTKSVEDMGYKDNFKVHMSYLITCLFMWPIGVVIGVYIVYCHINSINQDKVDDFIKNGVDDARRRYEDGGR